MTTIGPLEFLDPIVRALRDAVDQGLHPQTVVVTRKGETAQVRAVTDVATHLPLMQELVWHERPDAVVVVTCGRYEESEAILAVWVSPDLVLGRAYPFERRSPVIGGAVWASPTTPPSLVLTPYRNLYARRE